ncbi:MAG: hypothetical protein WA633_14170 [Stellaceae bacterium]
MLRNLVRRGIRAVERGDDPGPIDVQNGQVTATFGHDHVVSGIPNAATAEEDRRLLRQVARNVVAEMIAAGQNKPM